MSNRVPTFYRWTPEETPIVVLSEGCFGEHQSKTALGVIRYGRWPVAAVLDSTRAGKTVREVTGIACEAPIVATLEEALAFSPKALLLGTAPIGGALPESWHTVLCQAVGRGLHVLNGLHFFLNEDVELARLAEQHQAILWDVRNFRHYITEDWQPIARMQPRPTEAKVITLVGSDCSVGKMHSALELRAGAAEKGIPSAFIATGQTGILIEGHGLPLDAVIGDFMAGYTESCILETIAHSNPKPQWVFVEGQGSLMHPAYSGVTLSLLHGSNPDAMILCHKPGITDIRGGYDLPVASLPELVRMYETAAAWLRPNRPQAKVAGIALNTSALSEADAQTAIRQAQAETGLPATDPVRYGVEDLLKNLQTQLNGT